MSSTGHGQAFNASVRVEQATAAPGEKRAIAWRDVPLGVMRWESGLGCYVLRIGQRTDLPLSFNVWTSVGE